MTDSVSRADLGRGLVSLVVSLAVMALLLFVPAGRLDWALGWWFLGVFLGLCLIAVAWMWRINPAIFAARSRLTRQGSKGWDVALVGVLFLCLIAVLVVAGLDSGRFQWAPAPAWAIGLGYVLLLIGFAGSMWAEAVNRHFEPTVRIQTERGHEVISTGPYAYIRHPGYISANILAIGVALCLGSLWALLPAVLTIALLGVRTTLEDATLHRELPGYAEFAQKTRFKWVPGLW